MHELGTVFYVIKQVEQLCVENNLSTVGSVTLEIGEVSGIIPKYVQGLGDKGHDLSQKHRAEDRDARRRHLLRGLRQDIPDGEIRKDMSLLRQRAHFLARWQ